MCYTALVYKTGENDEKLNQSVLDVFANEMDSNNDGFSYISKNKENKSLKRCRTMERQEFVENYNNAIKNNFSIVHFRIATTGILKKENTHFWKNGDYYFAHNGTIRSSIGGKSNDLVDSNVFFNKLYGLIKEIDKPEEVSDLLKAYIDEQGLWGRGFLIDSKKDLVYMFGDLECYLLDDNYIVICSTRSDFKHNISKSFGDMVFEDDDEDIEIKETDTDKDDINIFNLKKGVITRYTPEKIEVVEKVDTEFKSEYSKNKYDKKSNDRAVNRYLNKDSIYDHNKKYSMGIYLPQYDYVVPEETITLQDIIWGFESVDVIPEYILNMGIKPNDFDTREQQLLDGV